MIAQPVIDEGLHIAHFFTAVIADAGHQHRINGLLFRQFGDGVGKLNTVPGAGLGTLKLAPDIRRKHVAAYRHKIGIQGLRPIGLLDEVGNAADFTLNVQAIFGFDDGVFAEVPLKMPGKHLAAAGLVKTGDHRGQVVAQRVGAGVIDNDIRQNHHEGAIANNGARAENRVAQPQRLRLAYVHDGNARRADGLHFSQELALHALLKERFEFIGGVEMVFNRVFRRVSNQNDFFDTGGNDFIDNVLNHRLVNNGQHLFRNRLRSRQHVHPKTCYRNNRF